METEFDRSKSLQELESNDWGEPDWESSLVITCHRLRRKPLTQFTVEDLRIMIGQQIGLPFLIPIAIEALEIDPLAEGDHYPGDLLEAVLSVEDSFWAANPEFHREISEIAERAKKS